MTTSRSSASRGPGRKPDPDLPPRERARALALRLLAYRARTEAELRTRLAREELGGEADGLVAWLRGLGYLDDVALARARARSLTAPGKLGPRGAERRLAAAGVGRDEARRAVAEALAEVPGGEVARCRLLAERRAAGRPLAGLDGRARARLARFLLGRGFSGSAVSAALGGFDDRELDEP